MHISFERKGERTTHWVVISFPVPTFSTMVIMYDKVSGARADHIARQKEPNQLLLLLLLPILLQSPQHINLPICVKSRDKERDRVSLYYYGSVS